MSLLAHSAELLNNFVLLESAPSMSDGNKSMKTMYVHSLYAPYSYNGQTGVAKIFVEEYWHEGSENLREYEVKNIEPVSSNGSGLKQSFPWSEHTGSAISIADVVTYVKRYDKDFTPQESSVVVNGDGTPKVMYHGTNVDEDFRSFDTYGSKFGLFGNGSYFTENPDVAQSYTKKGNGSNPRVHIVFDPEQVKSVDNVGLNGEVKTVYNVGKIKEAVHPSGSKAKQTSFAGGVEASENIISQNEQKGNPEFGENISIQTDADGNDFLTSVGSVRPEDAKVPKNAVVLKEAEETFGRLGFTVTTVPRVANMPENTEGYVDFRNHEVYINPDAKNAQDIVIKHELTHILERSRGSRYVRSAMDAIKRKMPKVWEEAYQKNWEKYEKLSVSNPDLAPTRARIESETLADFSMYFAKDDVIRHYAMNHENRSFIQTMKDFFRYLALKVKTVIGTEKSRLYAECAIKWESALKEAVGNGNVHDSGDGAGYGVMYSAPNDKKSLSIKAQLKTHMKEIMLRPIAKRILFDTENGKSMSEIRNGILSLFVDEKGEKSDLIISRKEIGEVKVGYREIKKGLKYLGEIEELMATEAVPQVIKEGVLIHSNDNHKNRDYPTFTFAAPVELNGKKYAMAVVVKKTGTNKYKVHRLLFPDGAMLDFSEKETAEATPNRMTVENDGESRSITSAVDTSLSQDKPGVNSYSMQETEKDADDVSFMVSDSGSGASSGRCSIDWNSWRRIRRMRLRRTVFSLRCRRS